MKTPSRSALQGVENRRNASHTRGSCQLRAGTPEKRRTVNRRLWSIEGTARSMSRMIVLVATQPPASLQIVGALSNANPLRPRTPARATVMAKNINGSVRDAASCCQPGRTPPGSNSFRAQTIPQTWPERGCSTSANLDFGQFANWPKSKLAEVEIGRSRNWPKSKLAEVETGRSRNWPKSNRWCLLCFFILSFLLSLLLLFLLFFTFFSLHFVFVLFEWKLFMFLPRMLFEGVWYPGNSWRLASSCFRKDNGCSFWKRVLNVQRKSIKTTSGGGDEETTMEAKRAARALSLMRVGELFAARQALEGAAHLHLAQGQRQQPSRILRRDLHSQQELSPSHSV